MKKAPIPSSFPAQIRALKAEISRLKRSKSILQGLLRDSEREVVALRSRLNLHDNYIGQFLRQYMDKRDGKKATLSKQLDDVECLSDLFRVFWSYFRKDKKDVPIPIVQTKAFQKFYDEQFKDQTNSKGPKG